MRRWLLTLVLGLTAAAPARSQEAPVTTVHAAEFSAFTGGQAETNRQWRLEGPGGLHLGIVIEAEGVYTAVLVAQAIPGEGGDPDLRVSVDGRVLMRRAIGATSWVPYTFSAHLAPGMHEISIESADTGSTEQPQRAVVVAHLSIVSPAEAPTAVALSADEYERRVEERRERLADETNARIRELRQGAVAVAVIDHSGEAVPGVAVRVQLLKHQFTFGTVLCAKALGGDADQDVRERYERQVGEWFNCVAPAAEMSWARMEPEQDHTDYASVDAQLEWCGRHGLRLRGRRVFQGCRPFVPDWIEPLADRDLRNRMTQRARLLAARYAGRIDELDLNDDILVCGLYEERLGSTFLRQLCHEAHAANPDARLYVGSSGLLSGERSEEYFKRIRLLQRAGVDLDGLGIQAEVGRYFDPQLLQQLLDDLAEFELPIMVTDFQCDARDKQVQARNLEDVYRTVFAHPSVVGIMTANCWAGCSESPSSGLLDEGAKPTPVGLAHESLVCKQWRTDETGTTDEDGLYSCDAFFGTLEVTATTADGRTARATVQLTRQAGATSAVLQLGKKGR